MGREAVLRVAAVAAGAAAVLLVAGAVAVLVRRRVAAKNETSAANAARLERVLARVDAANREDPRQEPWESPDGAERSSPKELLYSQRMSAMLRAFAPSRSGSSSADACVAIAARAHHVRRWTSPRTSFPTGLAGYKAWRSALYKFHGDTAAEMMLAEGFTEAEAAQVRFLLSKKGIAAKDACKRDDDAQLVEDVACLVFLQHYWQPFSQRDDLDEPKLIRIVQKTWPKMSDKGHEAALKLDLAPEDVALIGRALTP